MFVAELSSNNLVLEVFLKSFFKITFKIYLPNVVERIRDKLAENLHELWSMRKIEQGWTYGDVSALGRLYQCLLSLPLMDNAVILTSVVMRPDADTLVYAPLTSCSSRNANTM